MKQRSRTLKENPRSRGQRILPVQSHASRRMFESVRTRAINSPNAVGVQVPDSCALVDAKVDAALLPSMMDRRFGVSRGANEKLQITADRRIPIWRTVDVISERVKPSQL